jgi:hypothetical protein
VLISPPDQFPITADGKMEAEFARWVTDVTRLLNNLEPLTGSGSPEGVQVASAGRWYVDTAAAAGGGIYFKEAGDGDTGWEQRS